MIFPPRRERAPQARTGTYLFRRQPNEDATDKVKIVPTGNSKKNAVFSQTKLKMVLYYPSKEHSLQ